LEVGNDFGIYKWICLKNVMCPLPAANATAAEPVPQTTNVEVKP